MLIILQKKKRKENEIAVLTIQGFCLLDFSRISTRKVLITLIIIIYITISLFKRKKRGEK
jgi:hypothetical protein